MLQNSRRSLGPGECSHREASSIAPKEKTRREMRFGANAFDPLHASDCVSEAACGNEVVVHLTVARGQFWCEHDTADHV